MTDPQAALKAHCQDRLDREATVHASGHQKVHARRYLLPRKGGGPIEIAIIVKPGSKLQIWCEADGVNVTSLRGIECELRPGSETYSTKNARGDLLYRRHAALKTFDRLHRGDGLRLVPKSIGDVDRILDVLTKKGLP